MVQKTGSGGIAVQMTDSGGFRLDAGGLQHELGFDPLGGPAPWCLTVLDTTGRCLRTESFFTLDTGLMKLAECGADRHGMRGLFRILLPDGRSFLRPGDLPAEDILHKFGYRLVGSVRAFLVAPMDLAVSAAEAYAWFRRQLGPLSPLLGSVDLADRDASEASWCGDVVLPANGFYRSEGLAEFAQQCVGGCGIHLFPEMGIEEQEIPDIRSGVVMQFEAKAV